MEIIGRPPQWALRLIARHPEVEIRELTWRRSHPIRIYRATERVKLRSHWGADRAWLVRNYPDAIITVETTPADRWTSGRTWSSMGRIVITAGTDAADCRLTLIHEMAHLLNRGNLPMHGPQFWAAHWKLCLSEQGMRQALLADVRLKAGGVALRVARDMGVRGAVAAQRRRK